jgi:hypothetical protein
VVQPFLLAGWLIQALQMSITTYASDGFECSGPHGEPLRVVVTHMPTDSATDILSVHFSFSSDEVPEICWKRTNDVIVGESCSGGDGFKVAQQIDTNSPFEALSRYFVVGESTVRYAGSLQVGLELSQLQHGP